MWLTRSIFGMYLSLWIGLYLFCVPQTHPKTAVEAEKALAKARSSSSSKSSLSSSWRDGVFQSKFVKGAK